MTSSADDVEGGGIRPLTANDPARVGPYQLLGRLGAGGMGRVYLARTEGGRTVAVKVVHEELVSDTQFRERFRREISAARKVGARYTAPVLDAGPDDVRPWVATGYVPGLSLEQVVREHGPLPTTTVRALAGFLLRALADIHATGIVHRDLKPSNVMLTAEGAKVIDFGIARALEPSVESLLTSTGMVIGSPGFMSPEQVLGGELGPGSDVFAVGCVLTYAATGKLAFGQGATNQHAINYRTVEGDPDLDGIADPALRALVARCLTKDVDERPAVADLLDDAAVAPAPDGGTAWLPADLLDRLARHTARLLDVDSIPLREEPADRNTVGLLAAPGPGAGTGVMPEPAQGGGPQQLAAGAPAAGGKGKPGEGE
ncbi:MAG: serine/threonine protein kinase, partial [Actinomycetia bacterium]|nr:serine/threonine protein kinase [Actinomycetes bacterium]